MQKMAVNLGLVVVAFPHFPPQQHPPQTQLTQQQQQQQEGRKSMAFNYVVTAHKPTSVTSSLVGHFTAPDEVNLIISKSTRLEIHLLTPEGLQPLHDVGLYGRIATMQLFRPKGLDKDLLFITTERYKFCVLGYKDGEIITMANGDVQDRIGRPADVGQIGIIDPDCRMIGLHLYDGLFKVIPMDPETGQLQEAFNIRLEELQVIDIVFLHGSPRPTICVLYQDSKEARHIKTYEVSIKKKEFVEGDWSQANVEASAAILIPIPVPLGGVLILGEQTITYHPPRMAPFKSVAMKTTIIKSYGKVDPDGSRYLLGDHLGNLFILLLQHDGQTLRDLKLEWLGETCCSSTISYLDNGVVYIGSLYGDPMLVKLNATQDEQTGTYIEVIETYTNLGPIVDLSVVDLERQGQGQVVTCSGAFKDGSLRIIRNGIGINEQAEIELPGLKGIWSLRPSFTASHHKYLVVSFISETRVLAAVEEELEERQLEGFETEKRTLHCCNAINDQFLQVTEESVRLIDGQTMKLVSEWKEANGGQITVVSCNPTQVVAAVKGGLLYYLEVRGNQLQQVSKTQLEHEIACLDITPLDRDSGEERSALCAVGLWKDISVRVLALPSLQQGAKELLGGEIIPRSVLLASFEGHSYLLCGLGDGHLYNFVLDPVSCTLSERKKVSLATQPVLLHTFHSNGATHVFTCSDRPTVIYSSNKKLLYANVNLKEVNHVCLFHTESFPDSLALASEGGLTIGTIDEIQKLHIRTVPLKEMPRRICHQESTHTFALLTAKITFTADEEEEINFVRLLDDQTFECLDFYALQEYENGCSVISCSFQDDAQTYYVVGTAFADPQEPEPSSGRLLVFSAADNKLTLVTEKEVRGAVYCLDAFNGKLLACVNSKVHLLKWIQNESTGVRELTSESSHHGHILALFAVSRGDFIVVGDLMKSISLLVYKSIDGVIEEIARDYNPNWMTAIEVLDDDTFIGAENSFNLFTVRKNSDAATDDERGRLEVVGEYHLGEFVNRFRHGSLVMKMPEGEGLSLPTIIFGTVNGAIGVVASLPEEMFRFLSKLQDNLSNIIKGVGGLSHAEWRSFANERRTAPGRGFIDGDLIESFLYLKREDMEAATKGLDISVDDLTKRIESLVQAIH